MTDDPDLEARWRDWRAMESPQGLPDDVEPVAVPSGGQSGLRPPGVRTMAVVLGLLVLVVAGVAGLLRRGADGDPRAALPAASASAQTGTGGPPARGLPARDLTSLASADASGYAGSSVGPDGTLVSYLPANVVDGDPTTAWRTDGPGDGQTLTLQFARDVTVTRMGLAVGEPATATSDGAGARQGRDVQQVSWTMGDSTVRQSLDPTRLDLQDIDLPDPVTTRTVTLRLDRTAPGPVASDDFAAVTQVVVLGQV